MQDFWLSFIPQLLATLVGAGIGVLGVFVAFGLQRRASATDGVDRAVETLLLSLNELVRGIDEWERESNVVMWSNNDRPRIHHPHPGGVSVAIELLKLKSPARERMGAELISQAWDTIASTRGTRQKSACGIFAGAVLKWHEGKTQAEYSETLRVAQRIAEPKMTSA